MESLSETYDDSSGANPSSVKSEDGSPRADGDRGSPPPNCAICLGRCRNKSFTDSCLHQFCFKCLVTWSKVKTECPLCKQNFKSIIHNVRSNQQYEEYRVEQRLQEEDRSSINIDDLVTATRRFRYRTTLTFPRGRERLALQQLLLHYPPLSAVVEEAPGVPPAPLPSSRRRRSPTSFRRTVYRHNLWARPLPDFTGRFRDCTPEFYRYNDSQMHRLLPWLNRELHYLLLENISHIAYVLRRILELLPQYHITSPEFREEIYRYLGTRTDHFLHELQCFASTPYDLTGYDRNVQYTTDLRLRNTVNDVISSSDTESGDSDIVLVSTPPCTRPPPANPPPYQPRVEAGPAAGPSLRRPPDPVYPHSHIAPQPGAVVPIETISHSDTDDDEVMVTGYIKPPQQRTPEVVDLIASDSDVVVQDDPPPEPAPAPEGRGVVKLSLSRRRVGPASGSDSDDASYTPPLPPPPRRQRRKIRARVSDPEYNFSGSVSDSSSGSRSGSCSSRTPPPNATDSDDETADNTPRSRRAYHVGRKARRKRNRQEREAARIAATVRHEREAAAARHVIEAAASRHEREVAHTRNGREAATARNEKEAATYRHNREAVESRHERETAVARQDREAPVARRARESTPTSDDIPLSEAKYEMESAADRDATALTSTADNPSPVYVSPTPERERREKDKRSKRKSRNGKGVKSSKTVKSETAGAPEPDQPGPSGLSSHSRRKYSDENPARGSSGFKRKHSDENSGPNGYEKRKKSEDIPIACGSGTSGSAFKKRDTEDNAIPGGSGLSRGFKKRYTEDNSIPDGSGPSSGLKNKPTEDNYTPGGSALSNGFKKRLSEENPIPGGSGLSSGFKKRHTEDIPIPGGSGLSSDYKKRHTEDNPIPGGSGLSTDYRTRHTEDNSIPGGSGLSGGFKKRHTGDRYIPDSSGPSSDFKKKQTEDNSTSGSSGLSGGFKNRHAENHVQGSQKRLKSVVKKASEFTVCEPSKESKWSSSSEAEAAAWSSTFSDSDDDIPLNLTIQRPG